VRLLLWALRKEIHIIWEGIKLIPRNYRPPDPPCSPDYDDPFIFCSGCDKVFTETDPGVDEINIKTEYCPTCIGMAYYESPTLLQQYIDELEVIYNLIDDCYKKRFKYILNEIQKMIDEHNK
jgi:hypothetical protein